VADVEQVDEQALADGLDRIRAAPRDTGTVDLIVSRPDVGGRHPVETAELSVVEGLVGDNWRSRGSRSTADGSADPDRQLTVMNARAIALFAGDPSRWALAGDQLYLDLDISQANLPAGTRLRLGDAVIEVTAAPHNGCAKFSERYGLDVTRFVNSPEGKQLRLRGLNARVVVPGTVRVGDAVTKLSAGA
jgi:hypothetical protein